MVVDVMMCAVLTTVHMTLCMPMALMHAYNTVSTVVPNGDLKMDMWRLWWCPRASCWCRHETFARRPWAGWQARTDEWRKKVAKTPWSHCTQIHAMWRQMLFLIQSMQFFLWLSIRLVHMAGYWPELRTGVMYALSIVLNCEYRCECPNFGALSLPWHTRLVDLDHEKWCRRPVQCASMETASHGPPMQRHKPDHMYRRADVPDTIFVLVHVRTVCRAHTVSWHGTWCHRAQDRAIKQYA